jgi:hypothetical protein
MIPSLHYTIRREESRQISRERKDVSETSLVRHESAIAPAPARC